MTKRKAERRGKEPNKDEDEDEGEVKHKIAREPYKGSKDGIRKR